VRTAAAVAAVFLAGCPMPSIETMVFFPDRDMPARSPADVEDRTLVTRDGVKLHAWRAGPSDARFVLVWSHGNAGNIANRYETLQALARRGLGVLAYDYRGYGRSEGRPSESGVYLDAEAAYDSERERGVAAERIVAFGESLGSAVSAELAARRPCAALAVVSPFTTLREVARSHYGFLGGLAGSRFDALSRVEKLDRPVFVAHGDRDEIVPYALGERLYAAARGPKRFFTARGYHHNDVFDAPGLLEALDEFLARDVLKDAE
jgi:uncharacterized protein